MRQILIIALREYKQYIFSRGFLLFLIMFPLGLVAATAAVGLLERNKPVRNFVVYDESGRYTDDIDREIERRALAAAISAWDAHVTLFADPAKGGATSVPAPFAPAPITEQRLQAFEAAGGFDAAKQAASPYVRDNAAAFVMPRRSIRRIPLPPEAQAAGSLDAVATALRPYLLEERLVRLEGEGASPLFAAILIPGDFGAGDQARSAQYWSRNLTDKSIEDLAAKALDSALRRELMTEIGMPRETLDRIVALKASLEGFRPDRVSEEAALTVEDRVETALPAALTYMLLVIIFGVGNLLLTNTIEERSNKIVEILLSSVTANQLMMGKLLGIAAVGLTMPSIFLIGGAVAAASSGGETNVAGLAMSTLFSSNLLAIYLFYFLCAYLIFAMIFLAIGAMSNSLQDAQSYMGPVMLVVFAPLPFMVMVFQNPNGLVASILTWIPIYTPYAVMMRAAADPPLWEIIGATALMLAFTVFLMRVMGRIFRQAILQAAPPKLSEVWKLAARTDAA